MASRKIDVLVMLPAVHGLVPVSLLLLSAFRSVMYDEAGASRRLRVAAVAMAVACDVAPAVNLQRMLDLVRTITREHRDVDLILFGETITGWYSRGADSRQYHQSIAEAIPGKTPAMLSASASEFRVNVCFGMSEASDGKLFNSQVLIDPTGTGHRRAPQGEPARLEDLRPRFGPGDDGGRQWDQDRENHLFGNAEPDCPKGGWVVTANLFGADASSFLMAR